jgi:hypothetical protein
VWPGRWDVCFGGVAGVGEGTGAPRPLASWPRRRGWTSVRRRCAGWAGDGTPTTMYQPTPASTSPPTRPVPPGRRRGRRAGPRAPGGAGRMARRARPVRRQRRTRRSPARRTRPGGCPRSPDRRRGLTPMAWSRPRRTVTSVIPGRRCDGPTRSTTTVARCARREPAALWGSGPSTHPGGTRSRRRIAFPVDRSASLGRIRGPIGAGPGPGERRSPRNAVA